MSLIKTIQYGDNRYIVCDDGTIYNTITSKILNPQKDKSGYYKVRLYNNREFKDFYVHRLVAESFLPPPPSPNYTVIHMDGKKENNDIKNLIYVTKSNATKIATNRGAYKNRSKRKIKMINLETKETLYIEGGAKACAVYLFSKDPSYTLNTYNVNIGKCLKGSLPSFANYEFILM